MFTIPNEESKALEKLLNHLPSRSFAKGTMILHAGDTPRCGYFIRDGVIKTSTIDSGGVERPVLFDMQGEIFPISWLMSFFDTTQYYYMAYTDVVATEIQREDLQSIMKSNPHASYDFARTLARRLVATQMRVEALEQSRATDKLVYTLRYMCTRFGRPVSTGKLALGLEISQQELANFVGLTRETTAIELKKLQSQGAIDYDRTRITVDLPHIESIIESLR